MNLHPHQSPSSNCLQKFNEGCAKLVRPAGGSTLTTADSMTSCLFPETMAAEKKATHIVLFPWLAMGHLLPFHRLSKLLALRGYKVSFVSTPRNLSRLPKTPPHLSSKITFVSLPLPPHPDLPQDAESSNDIPYNKQQLLKAAFDLLEPSVSDFLTRVKPDLVIYDYASHWLPSMAAKLGISRVYFSLFSAACLCFMGPPSDMISDRRSTAEDFTVVPHWIPFESDMAFRLHEVTRFIDKMDIDESGPSDFVRFGKAIGESDAVIVRSCAEFETEWLGLLDELYRKPIVPIGFLPPIMEDEEEDGDGDGVWDMVRMWLDKQRVDSVVYVALGTEVSLTRDEIDELALGLEKSMLPFFWVLRDDSDILPAGFEERVKGRGMVHVGWAPQTKIVSHDSVGGFLTHCGWNSVIEGLSFGRVLILFPVQNDQGLNARLLNAKRLGVEIPRDESNGSFDGNSVAESVRSAMVSESGELVRRNAKEMKGLFGDKDKNVHYVDQFVLFLEERLKSAA